MTTWTEMAPREKNRLVGESVMGRDMSMHAAHSWDPLLRPEHAPSEWEGARACDHCGLVWFEGDPEPSAEKGCEPFPTDYAGDIAHAWVVVEKLNDLGLYVSISKPSSALTWDVRGWDEATNATRFIAHADTAPEAICLAALRAKGVDV